MRLTWYTREINGNLFVFETSTAASRSAPSTRATR